MNWSYLAGLFDGEGSVTLTQKGKGWGVIMSTMCIAGNSKCMRSWVALFLLQNGVRTREDGTRNPRGYSVRISANAWKDCKVFAEGLLMGGVVEKRPHVELFLQAVRVWEARRRLSRRQYIARMDEIRRRLHALAKKGPKALKPWRYPPDLEYDLSTWRTPEGYHVWEEGGRIYLTGPAQGSLQSPGEAGRDRKEEPKPI